MPIIEKIKGNRMRGKAIKVKNHDVQMGTWHSMSADRFFQKRCGGYQENFIEMIIRFESNMQFFIIQKVTYI